MSEPRRGGPEKCPRPCVECDGTHHFSDSTIMDRFEDPEHEAARAEIEFWYQCKHCDAWEEIPDDEYCLPTCPHCEGK